MKCPQCRSDNPSDSRFCRKCASPLIVEKGEPDERTSTLRNLSFKLSRGDIFAGRYEVIEELGRGGMARVYKVFDRKLGEDIALKQIKPEIAAEEKTIERFRNEIKFARKIAHRNVCRMYDLGESDGIHFITMEYIPGEDLRCLIRRIGQFTVGKAVDIARQICDGLIEAHRLGVIHRDIKPQNIMIDQDGNARIMDFGISRFRRVEGITDTGVLIGTPEYMSPEQVEGIELDRRTDIYSVGVVLYEMLTGRVPFDGSTPVSIAVKQKSEIPQDPRSLNAQIPLELNGLILKCMEKKRERRYQKAEDVRLDLKRIEDGLPTTDRVLPTRKPITSKEITLKFSVKKLIFPLLAVLVAVLTVVAVRRLRMIEKPDAVISVAEEAQAPSRDLFDEGMVLFEREDFDSALDRFQSALAGNPDHFDARLYTGICLRKLQRPELAVLELEKAVRFNSLDPRPFFHLGEIYEESGDLEKAVDCYGRYLDCSPGGENLTPVHEKIATLRHRMVLSGTVEASASDEPPLPDQTPAPLPKKKPVSPPAAVEANKESVPGSDSKKAKAGRIREGGEKTLPEKAKVFDGAEKPQRVRIIKDNAPARLEPKSDAAVIHRFPLGIVLSVNRLEGSWFAVEVPGKVENRKVIAYIRNLDVEGIAGEDEVKIPKETSEEAGLKVKVVRDHASARQSPDTGSPILRNLPLGLVLTQIGRSGEWIAVDLGPGVPEKEQKAYVLSRDVEVIKRNPRQ